MYVDLSMFASDRSVYLSSVEEINNSTFADDIKKIKLTEAETKYKNSIRKYLSVALNKVNEVSGDNFSLYKIGKDLDANFKVIEGKVRKNKQEIVEEFNKYQGLISQLDDKKKKEFLTAMNIIVDYSDDAVVDSDRDAYLRG